MFFPSNLQNGQSGHLPVHLSLNAFMFQGPLEPDTVHLSISIPDPHGQNNMINAYKRSRI